MEGGGGGRKDLLILEIVELWNCGIVELWKRNEGEGERFKEEEGRKKEKKKRERVEGEEGKEGKERIG